MRGAAIDRAWLRTLPGTDSWRKVLPVRGGYGHDQKFEVWTRDGQHLLLRVAAEEEARRKYAEFAFIQRCQALGFAMPHAVSCGLHRGLAYEVLTWVEGEPLTHALIGMPESEQYRLGQEAGRALAAIHSVVLEPGEWQEADGEVEKRKRMVFRYLASRNRMAGDNATIMFIARHVAAPKRLAGLHGDFHIGNLLLTPEAKLGVIDFDRRRVGDRWQDFQRAQTFSVPRAPAFVNGQLHAYFLGDPPDAFWEAFAYEAAYGAIGQIVWAESLGDSAVAQMQASYARAARDFRGFTPCEPPRWYVNA